MGLAGLRQGTAHLKQGSSGKRKWTPFISWKNGDSKTIAFVTPIDQVAKIKIHDFVKVPDDGPKGWHFDHFMCRKDPAWLSESGGECYLCDVVGHKPKDRHVAVAVELDVSSNNSTTPPTQTLSVRTKSYTREDGTVVEYPQWGLVQQGFKNFYNYFTAFGQKWGGINHTAFDVNRIGGDQTTSYVIMPLVGMELPDLTEFEGQIPTILELVEEMGSAEKYASELTGAENLDQGFEDSFAPADQDNSKAQTKFAELAASLEAAGKVESFSG